MLNKSIKEKIFLEINNYIINIYIKENNIYIEIESNNNDNIIYYNKYSLKNLNNNQIFKKYSKIQESYDFLYHVINNSNKNSLKIEEYETKFEFTIKLKNELITFNIDKKNKYEKKDDSIFKNNLNNFENILKEIENDMNNLDPYIKELKDENEKITEENIKLKKEIEILKEKNEKLKQELINLNLDKKNSKDNFISISENNKEEKIQNENKIKVERRDQKLNQEKINSESNEKNSNENFFSKNNQETIKFEGEKTISKNENQQNKRKLNDSDSSKKIIKENESNSNNNNILSKDLENKFSNYIKESETYKDKNISFKLLYKASIDGDSASTFHKKVDDKGPIIVIIKTNDDRIIGGFSSKSWSSKHKYIEDNEAFLFSNFHKFKFNPKYKNAVCYHNKEEGPHFGINTLIISDKCLCNNNNICGNDTFIFKNQLNLIGAKYKKNFKIIDYEVYNVKFKE